MISRPIPAELARVHRHRVDAHRAAVEVGRRLYARGYTASNDGNISARLDAHRLLMTPKSVCKGFMDPAMMCVMCGP